MCRVKLGYEWGYLYVALCPFTGDLFALFLSHLDKDCFRFFLGQLQAHLRKKGIAKALLIGDGASAHTSQDWQGGEVDWEKLPTACPELNPVERFFEQLRAGTANRVFDSKQQVEQLLENLITEYQHQPQAVMQLTLYPYISKCA